MYYVAIAKTIFTSTKKSQTRTGNIKRKGRGGSEATFPYYFTTLKEADKQGWFDSYLR
jgi:hypothetical protein